MKIMTDDTPGRGNVRASVRVEGPSTPSFRTELHCILEQMVGLHISRDDWNKKLCSCAYQRPSHRLRRTRDHAFIRFKTTLYSGPKARTPCILQWTKWQARLLRGWRLAHTFTLDRLLRIRTRKVVYYPSSNEQNGEQGFFELQRSQPREGRTPSQTFNMEQVSVFLN